ncbi:MAG: hypothetical protein GF308_14530 [Candidatus Heimdallarchaeota archaeon]|nr:hypothetical protein [Candidatus Heimdallarchaeota archaeon]
MREFNAFLGPGGLLAFAIIFLLLGILSLAWLIMYQEADPDRTIRGSIARAIATSVFLGLCIHMFLVWNGVVL